MRALFGSMGPWAPSVENIRCNIGSNTPCDIGIFFKRGSSFFSNFDSNTFAGFSANFLGSTSESRSLFTNKSLTDLSYLHTAKKIFDIEKIYPKFATHNAHTIAAIYHMGYNKTYEFQRLFGMGELLYDSANKVCEHIPKASIYA